MNTKPRKSKTKELKPVCQLCVDKYKRDTNSPVKCPKCHKPIGCYWHDPNAKHIRLCTQGLLNEKEN